MTTEKKLKRGLYSIDLLLFLIIVLTYYGLMTFGHGLGDLVYVIALCVFVLGNTILTIIAKDKVFLTILLIISASVLCGTIWSTTIGRGVEYRWNGNVFLN